MAEAMAQPTACGKCVARLPTIEKNPAALLEYITGVWRPFSLSLELENTWFIMSTSGQPRAMSSPCSR